MTTQNLSESRRLVFTVGGVEKTVDVVSSFYEMLPALEIFPDRDSWIREAHSALIKIGFPECDDDTAERFACEILKRMDYQVSAKIRALATVPVLPLFD